MPEIGDPEIVYAPEDARLSLVSENAALWTSVEPDLNLQLAQANTAISMPERVRACLIEAIGDGDPSSVRTPIKKPDRAAAETASRRRNVLGHSHRHTEISCAEIFAQWRNASEAGRQPARLPRHKCLPPRVSCLNRTNTCASQSDHRMMLVAFESGLQM